MIQILVGVTIAIAGIAMLLERSWAIGLLLLAFGGIIASASSDSWFARFADGSDGDSGGDGGGSD